MAKTKQEWKDIESWDSEDTLIRLGELKTSMQEIITDSEDPYAVGLGDDCDEVIVLLLQLLKQVIREKKWTGTKPLQIFEGAYVDMSGDSWEHVLVRFRETKRLAEEYVSGDAQTKSLIKPKLVSRGWI